VVSYPEKNVELIFMIWDMEGQRRDPLLHRYFSGAEGALIVCDLTRFYTFEHLQSWAEELYSTVGRIPIIFIGNKSDLMEQIQYGSEELSSIAKKYKTKFYITSAKVGDNVENAFRELGIVMIS
ncbi:MAG: Rab family GTPase, partial [Candidatus Thermoplasmatota archaeon]